MSGFLIRSIQAIMVMFTVLPAAAQQESFSLSGRILDAKSRQPISTVSLKNGQQLVITNALGEFKISVNPGDHLVISHIAYQSAIHVVRSGLGSPLEILLEEKVVDLSEVEVNAFISEERFKQEILLAVPKYDYQNKLADRNLQMVKQIVPLDYAYDFSSYNTLFKNAKSVHEVSFFSSNPSVGLLKAIRQIGSRKAIKDVPPLPVNRQTIRKSYLPANDIFAPR